MIGWHVPEYQPGLPWWPLLVVIAAIIVINIVNNKVAPQTHYLLWSFAGSVVLVAIGLLDGNSFTDMGLGWFFFLSGFIWAAASIGLVAAVYVIGSFFRKTRQAFKDESIGGLSGGRLAFQALVEVPFGTVMLEEIAFRAVLFSMLARRFGVGWAIAISALLFGIWHVLPSIGTHERNPALGSVVGGGDSRQHPGCRRQCADHHSCWRAVRADATGFGQRHRTHGLALGHERPGLRLQLGDLAHRSAAPTGR